MSWYVRAVAYAPGASEALAQLRDGGRVLSRHQRVLNVEAAGGRLLALHTAAVPSTPFSLMLEGLPLGPWPEPGAATRLRDDVLALGHLRVGLTQARELRPRAALILRGDRPPAAIVELLAPFAAESAFGAWWRAEADSGSSGVARALATRARPALGGLAAALRREPPDPEALLRSAEQLMGLGPGGTPSGDDLLIGFTGAWRRLGAEAPGPERLAGALAARSPARTTRLAAEFYYHLSRGRLGQPLEGLLSAVARSSGPAVRAAAEALARHGATSGRDAIAGVHAYLSLDQTRRREATLDRPPPALASRRGS